MHSEDTQDLHDRVLESAKQLFIQRGYHGLSMREIAEAVGVSKAGLYYHFRDKEELFLAILDSNLQVINAIIDQVKVEGQSAPERIRLLVQYILTQPAEQRAVIRLASQEMAQLSAEARVTFQYAYHKLFIDRIQAIFQAGIEMGEFRPLDPNLATWTLLGMMYPYFYPAHSADIPPLELILDQIVSIFLEGVTPRK